MSKASTGGLVRKLVISTVFGVVVFAALSLYGDVQALGEKLGTFDVRVVVPALALVTTNYGLRFLRWQYYLGRLSLTVPAGESALVFTAGFVMSITPGKVGEVFKSLLLHERRSVPIARTAPIVVAERLTDLAALVIIAALGGLVFDRGIAVALTGAALVALLLVAVAWRPAGELGLGLVGRLPLLGRIAPRLRQAYESLYLMTRPQPLLIGTSLACVGWLLEGVALHVLAHGFPGVELAFSASLFCYAVPTIAGAIALVPGGLGVTEAGMTGVLQALGTSGMTAAVATAITMLVRLATLWWAVVLGVFALAWLRRTPSRAEA